MDKCLFCNTDLNPGSEEHVFLSALGARLITTRTTCSACNNAFANNETGKIDDALAEGFELVRNALNIWTGRNKPPPTIARAGRLNSGSDFDLAPGFTPVVRAMIIPGSFVMGSTTALTARDEKEVKRLRWILQQRKIQAELSDMVMIEQKVPPVHLQMTLDGNKVWRCVAKTAVAGYVVFHGNERARTVIWDDLRKSVRYGSPATNGFAGWDFVNDWPSTTNLYPHPNSPDAQQSGYEHSLIIAEVGELTVAYITLFGAWRFSVALGPSVGVPLRGLAVNPRSMKPARFVIEGQPPASYLPRSEASFKAEHRQLMVANQSAIARVLEQWSVESHEEQHALLFKGLMDELTQADIDEESQTTVIEKFARKVAALEQGEAWESALDLTFDEDKS